MCSRISIIFIILFDKFHYCVYVYWFINGLFFSPSFLYGLVKRWFVVEFYHCTRHCEHCQHLWLNSFLCTFLFQYEVLLWYVDSYKVSLQSCLDCVPWSNLLMSWYLRCKYGSEDRYQPLCGKLSVTVIFYYQHVVTSWPWPNLSYHWFFPDICIWHQYYRTCSNVSAHCRLS